MAGGAALLLDLQQDRVRVAVNVHFADPLHVAALLALAPELAAAAAVVTGLARTHRLLVRFPVHPGQHQDLARTRVLCDGRHQPARFLKINNHGSLHESSAVRRCLLRTED